MQVPGKGAQFLDRLGIAICGDADLMLLSAHIDTGSIRMDNGHVLGSGLVLRAFFGPYVPPVRCRAGRAREDREPAEQGYHCRRGSAGLRSCFMLIEPARSVGGTLTRRWRRRATAQVFSQCRRLYSVARASAWAFGGPRGGGWTEDRTHARQCGGAASGAGAQAGPQPRAGVKAFFPCKS